MGYPYGKRYIDKIRDNKQECNEIENAFYVLRKKYVNDHEGYTDYIDLSLKENFAILGEAFELASNTVGDIVDVYHFMWDVVEELLTPMEEERNETNI